MPRVKVLYKRYKLEDLEDYIRGEMKRKKITQKQMAEKLGIEQPTFARRLDGAKFSVEDIIVIFDELDTDENKIGRMLKV